MDLAILLFLALLRLLCRSRKVWSLIALARRRGLRTLLQCFFSCGFPRSLIERGLFFSFLGGRFRSLCLLRRLFLFIGFMLLLISDNLLLGLFFALFIFVLLLLLNT